jgi:hypothetical protein
MIKKTNNQTIFQCRKQLFKIAKQNKWIPYLYIIDNVINKRCEGPSGQRPSGYITTEIGSTEPLYGIDYRTYLCVTRDETGKMLTKWLSEWIKYIKHDKITFYDSLKKVF